MMPAKRLRGIWSAALTPITVDLYPDARKAIAYYHDLLARGCDGLNVLGTTGEAMSFSVEQRVQFMESLAASDLATDRIMVGTGASSLADTARLTRAAFECGFAAVLLMPPFFYRDASGDGVLRFFDRLFAWVTPEPRRVLLYNFPQMTGITFDPKLIDRLVAAFPHVIAGVKDSSNDARLQIEVLTHHPELTVFPSSERDLLSAVAYGAAGCISGSVALWPELARDVLGTGDPVLAQRLSDCRAALAGRPLISAVRYLTGKQRSDATWESPMPPLDALSSEQKYALDRAFDSVTARMP